jgi:hypothetical protein
VADPKSMMVSACGGGEQRCLWKISQFPEGQFEVRPRSIPPGVSGSWRSRWADAARAWQGEDYCTVGAHSVDPHDIDRLRQRIEALRKIGIPLYEAPSKSSGQKVPPALCPGRAPPTRTRAPATAPPRARVRDARL